MVQSLISKQHRVFDEDSAGPQDEGGEQVDVDVVPGAAELSKGQQGSGKKCTDERLTYAHANI